MPVKDTRQFFIDSIASRPLAAPAMSEAIALKRSHPNGTKHRLCFLGVVGDPDPFRLGEAND
jgi:hypothetical protein